MSQYCDPSEIKAPGATDGEKLYWAIKASGIADDYLGSRYQLPLLQWGDGLRDHVRAIARYKTLTDRGWKPDNPADETIVAEYTRAMCTLESIATKGLPLLSGIVDSTPQLSEGGPLVATAKPLGWSWAGPLEDD